MIGAQRDALPARTEWSGVLLYNLHGGVGHRRDYGQMTVAVEQPRPEYQQNVGAGFCRAAVGELQQIPLRVACAVRQLGPKEIYRADSSRGASRPSTERQARCRRLPTPPGRWLTFSSLASR